MGGRKMLKSTRSLVSSMATSMRLHSKNTADDNDDDCSSICTSSTSPDRCDRCGIQTHQIKVWGRISVSDDQVFRGVCIRCNPGRVPSEILDEWKEINAPLAPMKPCATGMCPDKMAVFGTRKQLPALSKSRCLSTRQQRIGREPSSRSRQQRSGRSLSPTPPSSSSSSSNRLLPRRQYPSGRSLSPVPSTRRRQYPSGRGLSPTPSWTPSSSLTNSITSSRSIARNVPSSLTGITISEDDSESKQHGGGAGCVCPRCGVQTHKIGMLGRSSVTNDDVYRGTCIRCNADKVPRDIVGEWQAKGRSFTKVPDSLQSRSGAGESMTMMMDSSSSFIGSRGDDSSTIGSIHSSRKHSNRGHR